MLPSVNELQLPGLPDRWTSVGSRCRQGIGGRPMQLGLQVPWGHVVSTSRRETVRYTRLRVDEIHVPAVTASWPLSAVS